LLEGDFHLLESSRCIDAGDTTLTDPDGTICDIGAYYYPQPTAIDPMLSMPVSHELLSNYPNPFNPSTNINFVVEQAGWVNVSVYDITGRTVAELVNKNVQAGTYTAYWDAKSSAGVSLPSGSYWVRLNTPSQNALRRIVLIR
ncbi:T9SS type A sorting domain-containing protein, partial [bacterium]|nr:T9SS type A sorting domain-containing protein [bacterium]